MLMARGGGLRLPCGSGRAAFHDAAAQTRDAGFAGTQAGEDCALIRLLAASCLTGEKAARVTGSFMQSSNKARVQSSFCAMPYCFSFWAMVT